MKAKTSKSAEIIFVATILASIFVITLTEVSPSAFQREIVFAFEKGYIQNVDSPNKYSSLAKGPAVVTKEWAIFVDNILLVEEVQISGNPQITQQNVENRIQERIKGFDTFDVPKRREIAEWLEKVLNPPFGETFKIRKEEVIKEMGELTLTERNNEIKILLIRALGGVLKYGAEICAIPYLTKILEDETLDPETRALAAHYLGWSRRKSTVPYLVKFTKDRNNSVRRSVAYSLFVQSKKDPELMLPFVIEAIRVEEEVHAIQYFAWALRDIGNKNAIPALKEALARGVQRKGRSISYVIQALIRLDNSVIREILTDGSDFERRLLAEQVSYIRTVDSSFKEILLVR